MDVWCLALWMVWWRCGPIEARRSPPSGITPNVSTLWTCLWNSRSKKVRFQPNGKFNYLILAFGWSADLSYTFSLFGILSCFLNIDKKLLKGEAAESWADITEQEEWMDKHSASKVAKDTVKLDDLILASCSDDGAVNMWRPLEVSMAIIINLSLLNRPDHEWTKSVYRKYFWENVFSFPHYKPFEEQTDVWYISN